MNIDEFNQHVESSREQLAILSVDAEELSASESTLVSKVLHELNATVEELQIAQEELCQQNEDLLASYALLEVERQRYRDLFEMAPDGYLVTDLRGTIREANRAAAALLNVAPLFLVGKPLSTYIASPDRQNFFKQLTRLAATHEHDTWESCLTPRNGSPVPIEVRVSQIDEPTGEAIALRWIIRDISERKALAQEKELQRFKSQFISMLSHEIRNPLSTIMSSANLLKCGFGSSYPLTSIQQGLIESVQVTVTNINQLLEEMLLIERNGINQYEIQSNTLYLNDFCQTLVEEFRILDSDAHIIDLKIHTHSENLLLLSCVTPKLLYSVFRNLLSNALKYSPSGSTVTITLASDNGQAIVTIQDQGIGIPPEEQENLFIPFYRATNVGDVSGSGLGLFITKQFLELHDGQIAIASEVGKGTLVTLTLPIR